MSDISHCVGSQTPTVLINLVGIKTPVEFIPLFGGKWQDLLVSSDAIPQILNKFDPIFDRKVMHFRIHRTASFIPNASIWPIDFEHHMILLGLRSLSIPLPH